MLGDEDFDWRPDYFGYHLWGCEIGFKFPIVKLLDLKERWAFLETSRNPFTKMALPADLDRHFDEEMIRYENEYIAAVTLRKETKEALDIAHELNEIFSDNNLAVGIYTKEATNGSSTPST